MSVFSPAALSTVSKQGLAGRPGCGAEAAATQRSRSAEQNNALEYLADSLPEQTGEATKGRILMLLTRPRSAGQKNKTEI